MTQHTRNNRHRNLMRRVEEMPPIKAVEALMDYIEINHAYASSKPQIVDEWDLHLTANQRRLMIAFVSKPRVVLTLEALKGPVMGTFDGADVPTDDTVRCAVYKLRKALPAQFGNIETKHGIGYRYIPADQEM